MIAIPTCVSALLAAAFTTGGREPEMSSFAEVCPPGVVFVAEVPDFAALEGALERTGLMKFWDDPRLRDYFESEQFDTDTSFDDVLERAGVEVDSLAWPTGAAGLALIHPASRLRALDEGPEAFAEVLYSYDEPTPLVAADFGAGADAAEAAFEALVDFAETHDLAQIDGDHDDDRLVLLRSLVHERKLLADQALEEEYHKRAEAAGDDWEKMREVWAWYTQASEGLEETGDPEVDLLASVLIDLPTLAFARAGGVLMLSSDPDALSQALDALEDPSKPCAADEPFYLALQPRLAAGAEAWMYYNLELAGRLADADEAAREFLMSQEAAGEPGFDPYGPSPMDIVAEFFAFEGDGLGFALELDRGEALARVRFAAPTEAKQGAFALVDRTGLPFTLPAFAPADAISAIRLLVDLPAIPAEVDRIVNAMPEETRAQIRPILDQGMPIIQQICGAMGDEVHLISTREGMSAEAMGVSSFGQLSGTLIAVSLKDDRVINNLLSAFGGAMGLEGRNIEGGTLFTPPQEGLPIGLAVGTGRAFFGSVPQLEDALRSLAHPPEQAAEPNPFDRAKLDGRGPVAGFMRIKPFAEAIERQAEAMRESMKQYAEEAYIPLDDQADPGPEFPLDLLLEYVGDFAVQIDSLDWGFSGELVVLRPLPE